VRSTELAFMGVNLVHGVVAFLLMGEAMVLYKDWKDGQNGQPDTQPDNLWFIWCVGAVGIYVGLAAAVAFIGVQAKLNLFLVTHGAMVVVLMGCEGWLVVVLLMWKKQIPADPTGEMEKVVKALEANPELTKWLSLSFLAFQVASVLLAGSLYLMPNVPHEESEDEDDYDPLRLPLMHGNKDDAEVSVPRISPRGAGSGASRTGMNDHLGYTSNGTGSGAAEGGPSTEQWSQHMLTKYGVDTSQIGYNPERQQPVIAEEEPGRRCALM